MDDPPWHQRRPNRNRPCRIHLLQQRRAPSLPCAPRWGRLQPRISRLVSVDRGRAAAVRGAPESADGAGSIVRRTSGSVPTTEHASHCGHTGRFFAGSPGRRHDSGAQRSGSGAGRLRPAAAPRISSDGDTRAQAPRRGAHRRRGGAPPDAADDHRRVGADRIGPCVGPHLRLRRRHRPTPPKGSPEEPRHG